MCLAASLRICFILCCYSVFMVEDKFWLSDQLVTLSSIVEASFLVGVLGGWVARNHDGSTCMVERRHAVLMLCLCTYSLPVVFYEVTHC